MCQTWRRATCARRQRPAWTTGGSARRSACRWRRPGAPACAPTRSSTCPAPTQPPQRRRSRRCASHARMSWMYAFLAWLVVDSTLDVFVSLIFARMTQSMLRILAMLATSAWKARDHDTGAQRERAAGSAGCQGWLQQWPHGGLQVAAAGPHAGRAHQGGGQQRGQRRLDALCTHEERALVCSSCMCWLVSGCFTEGVRNWVSVCVCVLHLFQPPRAD